jgi:hypothetical protein
MINISHLTHAYRQAPWRIQRQWAGAFLLGIVGLAMISALYLDVTAQAAIIGREIQTLRSATIEVKHENADLQTRMANLLSTKTMEARAYALGFRPARAGEIHYLIVPGYSSPRGINMETPQPQTTAQQAMPSEYTQSLLEWISDYLQSPSSGIAGDFLQ